MGLPKINSPLGENLIFAKKRNEKKFFEIYQSGPPLNPNDQVQFDLEHDDNGRDRAVNVTGFFNNLTTFYNNLTDYGKISHILP